MQRETESEILRHCAPQNDTPQNHADTVVVQISSGAKQPMTISPELVGLLKELSRREGVTLCITLLVAFKILLYRYTGEYDILVGCPIAQRSWPRVKKFVGGSAN